MPANGSNLFHVSAIVDEKRLWALLRHMEAVEAYDVEVRPVAPAAEAPAAATAAAASVREALLRDHEWQSQAPRTTDLS